MEGRRYEDHTYSTHTSYPSYLGEGQGYTGDNSHLLIPQKVHVTLRLDLSQLLCLCRREANPPVVL